jgi:hypothetical protein
MIIPNIGKLIQTPDSGVGINSRLDQYRSGSMTDRPFTPINLKNKTNLLIKHQLNLSKIKNTKTQIKRKVENKTAHMLERTLQQNEEVVDKLHMLRKKILEKNTSYLV